MLWTWMSYRDHAGAWYRDRREAEQHKDPLARFRVIVDRLLYGVAAAFLICVVALLVR
jgi:hypothetical protein